MTTLTLPHLQRGQCLVSFQAMITSLHVSFVSHQYYSYSSNALKSKMSVMVQKVADTEELVHLDINYSLIVYFSLSATMIPSPSVPTLPY